MKDFSKKTLKVAVILGLFVFIASYAFFRSKNIILGIQIRDLNLEQQESLLLVAGNAKNAQMLTLNGREISIDKEGNFKETIALMPGYNIIEIKAEDKFGKEDEQYYKIIHTPPPLPPEDTEVIEEVEES